MGRATITGGGTDGLYDITIDTGSARVAAQVARLTNSISALDTAISAATSSRDAVAANEEDARLELVAVTDTYIAALQAGDPEPIKEAMQQLLAATQEYYEAQGETRAAQARVDQLRFARAAAQKELAARQSITTERTQEAWCVDLIEDASGTVATIEIPGETDHILISPQHPNHQAAPDAGDGQLLARPAMNGPQAYFNAAILPGWQRWMPTYRTGIASAIDYEAATCTVTLADIRSSAQNLPINQQSILDNVPISYMDCDALAFEEGDEVVVSFPFEWDQPTVIGFLHDPKPCWRLAYFFNTDDAVYGYPAERQPSGFDWRGRVIRCYDPETETWSWNQDYTNDGLMYFSSSPCMQFGVGFQNYDAWNENPANEFPAALTNRLTGVTQIGFAFVDLFNVLASQQGRGIICDFVYDRGPHATSGRMWVELVIRGGTDQSIFRVFSYPPSPYPEGETAEQKFFTFPAIAEPNYGNERRYVATVVFADESQALYIDGEKVAETLQDLAGDWHQLGSVAIAPLTPDFAVSVAVDFWAAR